MNTGILRKSTSNAYWCHGILIFTRVYSQPESEDIESLQSCQLLEEYEQNLKSLQNYIRVLRPCDLKIPRYQAIPQAKSPSFSCRLAWLVLPNEAYCK